MDEGLWLGRCHVELEGERRRKENRGRGVARWDKFRRIEEEEILNYPILFNLSEKLDQQKKFPLFWDLFVGARI